MGKNSLTLSPPLYILLVVKDITKMEKRLKKWSVYFSKGIRSQGSENGHAYVENYLRQ